MITATLTDSVGSLELPLIEVPLTEDTLDSSVDVITLDNNMYTDFTERKKQYSFPYSHLSEDDYNDVRAFYDRQFTNLELPTLSIPYYGVSNMVVRMYLNPKKIVDHCGTVEDVQLIFRETVQNSAGSS